MSSEYTQRPHGAEWDITGYEICELPFETLVGLNGCGGGHTTGHFASYKINIDNLRDRAGDMTLRDVSLMADIMRNNRKLSFLGSTERQTVEELTHRGFVACDGDDMSMTFPVFNDKVKKEYMKLNAIFERVFAGRAHQNMAALFDSFVRRIKVGIPSRLGQQAERAAISELCGMRMMMLRYALTHGLIATPHDVDRSTIAMYMVV